MTATKARLDLMNDGLQTTEELQNKIMASANRSRASYQTTADAVSKMGIMAKDAFGSNDELVQFSELINKQFTIAGTSAGGIDAAMLQLTQAMSSGVLRGEELNSVFEQAPTIIQTIADYLNVPIGKIREMAANGQITSTIVKNAMLSSADEINKKFESMPMTFAQVGTVTANMLLKAFNPALQAIGKGAQWIYDNWSTLEPIFVGLAAGIAIFTAAMAINTAVTWLSKQANQELIATMLKNPFLWIALIIGVVVGVIYKWIQSVGGLKIAWQICTNYLLMAWDWIRIAFAKGGNMVMNLIDKITIGFASFGVSVANFMGDMKANVLMILQNMVNGAIDIINKFISSVNKIPGVSIDMIDQVTFGTTAQIENEAAKQARNAELAAKKAEAANRAAERTKNIEDMQNKADAAANERKAAIAEAQAKKAAETAEADGAGAGMNVAGGKLDEVGKIKDDVNIADEDLKLMKDVAEMRYVQNFVTLTPTVSQHIGTVNQNADVNAIMAEAGRMISEDVAISAAGAYS
ncbi:MAG: tape measure protein [Oscillospiraceae bacterium]|nr:tape measure protein [Oscillospiraceae bacterium]MBS1380699.1 tape measure protein [Oscillospiraceae bacterium]